MQLTNRADAGHRLADELSSRSWRDPVVLGLVRGGVAVALPVAQALTAPLDVAVVRKIGAPVQPEFGVGAVTPEGPAIFDERALRQLRLSEEDLHPAAEEERAEARRRLQTYRAGRAAVELRGRDVIVVDDGIATGVSARAMARELRASEPARLVLSAPVCARDAANELASEVDEVSCLHTPSDLGAIGLWYQTFDQLDDDDVLGLLDRAQSSVARS